MEKAGWEKADTSVLWMEGAVRKDQYRLGQGKSFEYPHEANRADKGCLMKIFNELNGQKWNKKFGWVGQVSTHTHTSTTLGSRTVAVSHPIHSSLPYPIVMTS
jgi:hypothetical protein